ncbi:Uncharacterized SAM-binding protein YcdF, DUF218 family [Cyclobacterium lianum]|uniref:Uncharacterized SAM-binding protein YcdF, DUF218 family n=1 Tax=Cyclobacterium lianum TaxID=388280 RepID=A0A1M7QS38_9BACT|nr:YdcF family protein [Cyclobacterium lianum]SHN34481.1 Uncharacterized SAM-binding protein YcdF, DUF218 family [Cyclobacterium lianum]
MFFFLSQLFSFLIMPFTICLILVGLGLIFFKKSWGRKLVLGSFLLSLFFSNSYLANWVMYTWEAPPKAFNSLPEYDLGIVLTGVTHIDKLPKDRTFFNKGADRVTHALQLYKMGKVKRILITGGLGFDPTDQTSEAESLGDFLLLAGVDKGDLLLETAARNTNENALFTKRLLEEKGLVGQNKASLLLITSAFHMKRAESCFIRNGLKTETFPVDYYASTPKLNIKSAIQPSIQAFSVWHILVKEWVGILVYRIMGYI